MKKAQLDTLVKQSEEHYTYNNRISYLHGDRANSSFLTSMLNTEMHPEDEKKIQEILEETCRKAYEKFQQWCKKNNFTNDYMLNYLYEDEINDEYLFSNRFNQGIISINKFT